MSESAESRVAAAQRRAREAEERVIKAAQRGVKWKILRFFAQPTTAAWTALFYVLISSIGVIYSWAFYIRFDDIHIFQFFTTPDFLLGAFRDIKTLVIGVITILVGISILVYRVYNSSIYSAYIFDRDKYRRAQRARIKWEAAVLLSITLLFIFLTTCLWLTSPYFQRPPIFSLSPVVEGPHITILIIFTFLACCFIGLFYSLIRKEQEIRSEREEQESWIKQKAVILPSITLLFIVLIGIFFSWDWRDHSTISMVLLHLMSISLIAIALFAYCFDRIFHSPSRVRQESRIKWGGRFLAGILLVEGIAIIPFLSGVDDSKAALEDKPRPVEITLRRYLPQASAPLSDRILFLGTTSSFHFFCEDVSIDRKSPKCDEKQLRPFIIPTANIASLEFNPRPVKTPPTPPVTDKKCHLKTFHTVTHFPESEHDELEPRGEEILTSLFDDMTHHFKNYRLDRLILTGRVDINKFKSEKKRQLYGAQIELARARAEWVREELLKKFQEIAPELISVRPDGPRYVEKNGKEVPSEKRVLDRSVEVWAYWTPKEPDASVNGERQ